MFFAQQYKAGQRNWPIDFLRGVVVFIGATGHFYYLMWQPAGVELQPSLFSATLLYNISYGIAVFSPVSGFLITSMLLKQTEGKLYQVQPTQFYLLRFSRIMPGLIILCSVNLLFNFLDYPGFQIAPFTWQTLLSHVFTFRTNILFGDGMHHLFCWAILWSLAIEEVFYLLFPLLCLAVRSHFKLILVLIGLVFYGPYCRAGADSYASLRLYFGCFDQIALGCLAALFIKTDLFFNNAVQQRAKIWIGIGALLMISVYFLTLWTSNYVYGPTLIAIGTSLYLIGATQAKKNSLLTSDTWLKNFGKNLILPACILGTLSYEIYLFHEVIFTLSKPLITIIAAKIGWTWFYSFCCLSFLVGLLALLAGVWFFYCINPIRRKVFTLFHAKLDFLMFILIPRFFSRIAPIM